jgi:hypothetical protein
MGKTSENDDWSKDFGDFSVLFWLLLKPKKIAPDPRNCQRHGQFRQTPAGHRPLELIAVVSAAQADVPRLGGAVDMCL